jgi:hypothetical protein
VRAEAPRPAFYALAPGGWRDYVTLLHPPYTLWHLAYVVVGAAVASPEIRPGRLLPTLAAFALGLGVSAHALDELQGRPLGTAIPRRTLVALAALSLAGAVAIGLYGAATVSPWIALFVAVGATAAVAYNLELLGGRLHGDLQFALAWGTFPVLTGAFAAAERISSATLAVAAFAFLTALAQRHLSTQVRDVRRRVVAVTGALERHDGRVEPVTRATLATAPERALGLLAASHIALAVALVMMRAA